MGTKGRFLTETSYRVPPRGRMKSSAVPGRLDSRRVDGGSLAAFSDSSDTDVSSTIELTDTSYSSAAERRSASAGEWAELNPAGPGSAPGSPAAAPRTPSSTGSTAHDRPGSTRSSSSDSPEAAAAAAPSPAQAASNAHRVVTTQLVSTPSTTVSKAPPDTLQLPSDTLQLPADTPHVALDKPRRERPTLEEDPAAVAVVAYRTAVDELIELENEMRHRWSPSRRRQAGAAGDNGAHPAWRKIPVRGPDLSKEKRELAALNTQLQSINSRVAPYRQQYDRCTAEAAGRLLSGLGSKWQRLQPEDLIEVFAENLLNSVVADCCDVLELISVLEVNTVLTSEIGSRLR